MNRSQSHAVIFNTQRKHWRRLLNSLLTGASTFPNLQYLSYRLSPCLHPIKICQKPSQTITSTVSLTSNSDLNNSLQELRNTEALPVNWILLNIAFISLESSKNLKLSPRTQTQNIAKATWSSVDFDANLN